MCIRDRDSGLELTEITVTTEMNDGVASQVTLANGTIAQEGSLPMSPVSYTHLDVYKRQSYAQSNEIKL